MNVMWQLSNSYPNATVNESLFSYSSVPNKRVGGGEVLISGGGGWNKRGGVIFVYFDPNGVNSQKTPAQLYIL